MALTLLSCMATVASISIHTQLQVSVAPLCILDLLQTVGEARGWSRLCLHLSPLPLVPYKSCLSLCVFIACSVLELRWVRKCTYMLFLSHWSAVVSAETIQGVGKMLKERPHECLVWSPTSALLPLIFSIQEASTQTIQSPRAAEAWLFLSYWKKEWYNFRNSFQSKINFSYSKQRNNLSTNTVRGCGKRRRKT